MQTPPRPTLTADLDILTAAASRVRAHLETLRAEIGAALKLQDTILVALLIELADAKDDSAAHFDRYPSRTDADGNFVHAERGSPEQLDWSRCCERVEAAVEALTAFARGAREALAPPKPEAFGLRHDQGPVDGISGEPIQRAYPESRL